MDYLQLLRDVAGILGCVLWTVVAALVATYR